MVKVKSIDAPLRSTKVEASSQSVNPGSIPGGFNLITMRDIDKKICDWLVENQEQKLKESFVSDLSWIVNNDKELMNAQIANGYAKNEDEVVVNFFTKRAGKRVFDILPKDIREYIIKCLENISS